MLPKTTLPNTDLSVSTLCYGTNMLGDSIDQGRTDEILDTFVELGGNFLDTARMYGDWNPLNPPGASERAIGAWLKRRQHDGLVIATKGGGMNLRADDWANRCTPGGIAQDLADSLDHLGVESIDLYWLHADNPEAPVEPIIDALIGQQEAGRIRHFAASNWSADRVIAANAYAENIGKPGFVAVQCFWGLAVPDAAAAAQQGYLNYYEGLYEALHAQGMPMVVYGAQSGGYFTKLADGGADALPDGLKARYANPANAGRLAAAQAIAREHGVSLNEVALAYIASQPLITVPIFGGSSPEQVRDSVKAAQVRLSARELASLKAG